MIVFPSKLHVVFNTLGLDRRRKRMLFLPGGRGGRHSLHRYEEEEFRSKGREMRGRREEKRREENVEKITFRVQPERGDMNATPTNQQTNKPQYHYFSSFFFFSFGIYWARHSYKPRHRTLNVRKPLYLHRSAQKKTWLGR